MFVYITPFLYLKIRLFTMKNSSKTQDKTIFSNVVWGQQTGATNIIITNRNAFASKFLLLKNVELQYATFDGNLRFENCELYNTRMSTRLLVYSISQPNLKEINTIASVHGFVILPPLFADDHLTVLRELSADFVPEHYGLILTYED